MRTSGRCRATRAPLLAAALLHLAQASTAVRRGQLSVGSVTTVDRAQCYRHLDAADVDGDGVLAPAEFLFFARASAAGRLDYDRYGLLITDFQWLPSQFVGVYNLHACGGANVSCPSVEGIDIGGVAEALSSLDEHGLLPHLEEQQEAQLYQLCRSVHTAVDGLPPSEAATGPPSSVRTAVNPLPTLEPATGSLLVASPITTAFLGNSGCPCINSTANLASLTNRQCLLSPSGKAGVRLTLEGSCVPFSYGANQCLQHDLLHDSQCRADLAGEQIVPPHCFRPWCFVDLAACRKDPEERAFRSSYFSFDSGVDLFYSYSTCNSTAADWFESEAESDIIRPTVVVGGASFTASIPTYLLPMMYKRVNGTIQPSPGAEYYDDSIPFEGVYMEYVRQITETSNGDIGEIHFTHRARGSSKEHPSSSYTQAVQDIHDGLVDLSVGPFWVTAERLKLSSFTLPVVYDRTFLVIRNPEEKFLDRIMKVGKPFEITLWAVVLGIIVSAALLSVWFNDGNHRLIERGNQQRGERPTQRKKRVYARLSLDSFLQHGLFFFGAGIEQDKASSLPVKLLLFGFGFFILISVSAYVANLAAFLTLSAASGGVKTMEDAVKKKVTICAHPALETDMTGRWPNAKFFFHRDNKEFWGMLDDYDAKKCQVLAVGYEDTSMDGKFRKALCKRQLLYTESLITETPIAFPARASIAAGLSYWAMEAKKLGRDLQMAKDKPEFSNADECNVQFSRETSGGAEDTQITVMNMSFPIMCFFVSAAIAVILHLAHLSNVKKGKKSLVGRRSTFDKSMLPNDMFPSIKDDEESLAQDDDDDKKGHGWEQEEQRPGSDNTSNDFPDSNLFQRKNNNNGQDSSLFQDKTTAKPMIGGMHDVSFADDFPGTDIR